MRIPRSAALAAVVMMTLAGGAVAQDADAPSIASPNQLFVDYIQGQEAGTLTVAEDEIPSGLIPEPIKVMLARQSRPESLHGMLAAPPTSYDLRPLNKLTPIRDQGNCGSCWAFAAYGSLESYLKPAETTDFSENHLKNLHGFDIPSCSGGNRTMATAYLARWGGPISEVDDPYTTSSSYSPDDLLATKHVQNVIFVQNRTGSLDNDAIKQAVMNYGAVYTTYYHSSSCYSSAYRSYYYSGASGANHAVCIVGWNDSFPAASFNTPPPGNGAFLCRNSWGAYFGDAGYFWASYYDSQFAMDENAAITAEPDTNYDSVYQYDPLGWISSVGYGSTTAWFANVFTAVDSTAIQAAGWYFPTPSCSYQLYVYTSPTSGPVGGAALAASKSGTLADAGFRTIALDAPVSVNAGQTFSVVVRLTTPGYTFPVPIERPYAGYSSAATATAGQSYISTNGASWSDLIAYYPNANCCLKAYAKESAPPPGALSVTASAGLTSTGPAGGPFAPSEQTYALANTGGEPIDWTASKAQPWLSLSAENGQLAPGETAQVTVSVNADAAALAWGSYLDTVVFTNTTNGQGDATRSVGLTVSSVGPGTLSVTPEEGFVSTGIKPGPFSPTSQVFTLTNTGGEPINWTAAKSHNWVSLSATTGTLQPGASKTVTASLNSSAGKLAVGSYAGSVTFTNKANGDGTTTRPVSLTVNPRPDAYRVTKTAFAWIDPTGHTPLALDNDSATQALSIPFSFDFYGTDYSSIYVGSNGMVGFTGDGLTTFANTAIPKAALPNAALYGCWDDLDPALGGTVTMGVVGAEPNRQVVVTWSDVPHHTKPTATFSFQIVINETTNDIVFQYLNVSPKDTKLGRGRSATVGIENETGKKAVKWSYNSASVSNSTALLFTRWPAAAKPSYRW